MTTTQIKLFSIILFFLCSCSTYKKKLEKTKKFLNENQVELAKLCTEKFPVVERTVKGKTDTIQGQTVYLESEKIPCPDGTTVTTPRKQVTCPPSTERVDTLFVPDKAKEFVLLDEIKSLQDALTVYEVKLREKEKELTEAKKTAKNRLFIIIGLGALFGLGAVLKFKGLI